MTLEELLKVFLVGEEHPRYIIEENLRTFMEKKLIKKFIQSQTHLTQVDTFTKKNCFILINFHFVSVRMNKDKPYHSVGDKICKQLNNFSHQESS